jgi:hypothetical protein
MKRQRSARDQRKSDVFKRFDQKSLLFHLPFNRKKARIAAIYFRQRENRQMSLLQLGSNALIRQAFQSDAPMRQDPAFDSNATTAFGLNKNASVTKALQNASIVQASQSNAKASASLRQKSTPPVSAIN